MATSPRRPVYLPASAFENTTASDAEQASRLAHSTAEALLARARADESGQSVERLIALVDERGIGDIAELWSHASARSLPGTLWRLYLIQMAIHNDPETAALLYERGRVELHTADAVIAGAATPATAEEMVALIETILRGVFSGDFAVALERAAAFCRVEASGSVQLANEYEQTNPDRSTAFTKRALRLSVIADDLIASAALWRKDALN